VVNAFGKIGFAMVVERREAVASKPAVMVFECILTVDR
jgi:hypothetical protein